MSFYKIALIGLVAISLPIFLIAQDNLWISGRPDGHAPMGVMGDHTHGQGEFMLSYRLMNMPMEGMLAGTEARTSEEVLQEYLITPTEMPMNMHMFGAMYAFSDALTGMVMVNLLDNDMDHVTRMGGMFSTESGGLGDIRISGLYKFLDTDNQRMHAQLGLSLPTGSIDEQDVTPASAPGEMLLPYPMQIGSGTFDLLPALTYLSQRPNASFGAQLTSVIRLGENDRNYRLGHRFDATTWIAYRANDWISASLRGRFATQGSIEGMDDSYMMAVNNSMVPTVFTENSGWSMATVGGGLNLLVPRGALKDIRLGVELELPVYQDVTGVQLETDYFLTTAIQYAF